MFTIHQSNSNLALVSLLQRNLGNEQPAKSVFEPDTILVQSFGIATWLKARIAEFQGIAANLECVLPAEFIWRVYREVLGDSVPETSSFSRDAMLWKLMSILPAQLDHPDYNSLAHYLRISNNQQLRLYQLCNRIAGVFDEYLVYRPDWIMRWHSGEETAVEDLSNMATAHEKWQRDLWQKLSSYTESLQGQSSNHRVKLHEMLLGINPDDIQGQLPSRVSVFGVSSMPPQQLDVLRHISSHCAIDIYLLNPCQMYWGDIVPAKKKAKLVARQIARNAGLAEEDYFQRRSSRIFILRQKTTPCFIAFKMKYSTWNSADKSNPTEYWPKTSSPSPTRISPSRFTVPIARCAKSRFCWISCCTCLARINPWRQEMLL
jgi:exodeoxyribonuclease V gamma subunit